MRPTEPSIKLITTTDRLMLREWAWYDTSALYLLNQDPEVIRYTGDRPFHSEDEADNFIYNYAAYNQTGYGRWAVIRRKDEEFLGWCGLKKNEENLVDLGFRFHQKFWGKGYATEAARAALEVGFSRYKLELIIGRTARQNSASIRVLEKLGMTKWKSGECDGFPDALYFRMEKKNFTL